MKRRVCGRVLQSVFFIILLICLIISFTSCSEFGSHTEKYNIGDVPPEVIYVSYLAGYPVPATIEPPRTFNEFEKEVKESFVDAVIFECEMVEGGTLVKSFKNNNKDELGNYNSFVLTPVRITKIHYQDDESETKVNEGDVVYVKENYFWVTSDMEEVLETYNEGTYLTRFGCHYYPMMLGEKYIVYASVQEINDFGLRCERTVFNPYRGSAVYCISEDIIHVQSQKTHNWYNEIYHAGAWLKYSGKSEFKHEYADVFTEEEGKMKQVSHVDKTPFTEYSNFKEKNSAFKDNDDGYGVILKVTFEEGGNQIPVSGIDYLSDYEYCTSSDVRINTVLYAGEKVSDNIEQGVVLKVYEPYYMQDGKYITYSRYTPLRIEEYVNNDYGYSSVLYAHVYEINGETVLIPDNQASAVSLSGMIYPEHMQITLGAKGYLCYLETYAAGNSVFTEW